MSFFDVFDNKKNTKADNEQEEEGKNEDDFEVVLESDGNGDDNGEGENGSSSNTKKSEDNGEGKESTGESGEGDGGKKTEKPKPKKNNNNNDANTRIRQLIADRKELEKRNQELEEENRRIKKSERASTKEGLEQQKQTLEETVSNLNEQITNAYESGESEKVPNLNQKLMDSKIQLSRLNDKISEFSKDTSDNDSESGYEEGQERTKKQPEQSQPPKEAQVWVEQNPHFFTDDYFHYKAMKINSQLLYENYDPEDSSFYEELNERLSQDKQLKSYFEEEEEEEDGEEEENKSKKAKNTQTTSSSSRSGGANVTKNPNKKVIKLNADEKKIADRFGMSYRDYALSKQKSEISDGNGYTPVL